MSKLRFKAERYARKSFAFGEIGLIAYRMYDAARILNFPIHTYSDDIQRAALRIAQFAEDSENVRPVIFKINDLDMDLLEVESLGTLQDFVQKRIDVIPDLLQKKNDTFDMVLHYKGEVNLNPSDEIYL